MNAAQTNYCLNTVKRLLLAVSICAAIPFLSVSCRKEAGLPDLPVPRDSMEQVNRWILDSMLRYYYWSSELTIPNTLEGQPQDFFRSLVASADRFSWLSDGKTVPIPGNSFTHYGFHFLLAAHAAYSGTQLLGILTLVAPGSPADYSQLQRGSYFSKVNGIAITAASWKNCVDQLNSGLALQLTLVTETNSGNWQETGTITLKTQYFENRPVYRTQVFSVSDKRTGYLFYQAFTESFDGDLVQAFDKFKEQGITEFILDLRYNGGGSTASAAKLMALLAPVSASAIFARFSGNRQIGEVAQQFGQAVQSSSSAAARNWPDILSRRLNLNRMYVLSTPSTASAAELLINNLRPYLNVIQIGTVTTGKDLAGAVIRDQRQPRKINWMLQPMIYKIFNARGEGGYSSGLLPNQEVEELQQLPLFPLGDAHDPLVRKALQDIYSGAAAETIVLGEPRQKAFTSLGQIRYNSLTLQPVMPVLAPVVH